MPLKLPTVDARSYEQLVSDALARIPVHTPEWTHTGASDPGVTLVELFAFMAESLLYRANLIPERNRLKFLQLLGQPLRAAAPARALVALSNGAKPLRNLTLPAGLEFVAGALPFRSEAGLDVPPVAAHVCLKQRVADPAPELLLYYEQLYQATGRDWLAATGGSADDEFTPLLYETAALADLGEAVDLGAHSVDGALWIALLAPGKDDAPEDVRAALAGRTLSIGLVPAPLRLAAQIVPGTPAAAPPALAAWMPAVHQAAGPDGQAPYLRLDTVTPAGFPQQAGVVQVTLPLRKEDIATWPEAEPLEAGVGNLPPLLTDDALNARLVSWLRLDGLAGAGVRLAWAGLHCTPVTQRHRVAREWLDPGDGSEDQQRRLAHGQVLADSVRLEVGGEAWTRIDELGAAPMEGQAGARVFALDAEDGRLLFGNGAQGARPLGEMTVAYDWSAGRAGNVAAGAINRSAELPADFKVLNPVAAGGGTDAESADEAERRIPLVLRHRDRAVSESDFREILQAAPGADLGRVEVLAAWHPELSPALPGDQPGVVTAMVIPRLDPAHPDAPLPDADFIDALCRHLAPRRLVTCEVLLRPPVYTGVWISVGIDIVAGAQVAVVREAVRRALADYLSPLPPALRGIELPAPGLENGWPLFRAVTANELAAAVARTTGVAGVAELLLADASGSRRENVALHGLQLPVIAGLSVTLGDPVPLDDLIGRAPTGAAGAPTRRALPVPKVPSEC